MSFRRLYRWGPLFDAEGGQGGGTTPPPPDPGKTGDPTDYKALFEAEKAKSAEWQNRFTGLQREYQKDHDTVSQQATKIFDLTKALETKSGEFETLNIAHTKTKEEHDTRLTEYDVLKAQNERMMVIVQKFPTLIPYLSAKSEDGNEVVDLLPDGTGPELEKKLAIFANQVAKAGADDKSKNFMVTPPPPNNQTRTAEVVQAEYMEALSKGDVALYNKLVDEYLDVTKPK